ncbi:unnamed protein product [Prunus armeniaca]
MTSYLPFGRLPSEAWKDPSRHAMTSHLPFGRHDDVIPYLRKAPFRSLEGVLMVTSHLPFGRLPSEAWKESSRHVMTSHLPFGRHDDVIPSLRKAPFRSLEGVLTTRGDVTPSLRKA